MFVINKSPLYKSKNVKYGIDKINFILLKQKKSSLNDIINYNYFT